MKPKFSLIVLILLGTMSSSQAQIQYGTPTNLTSSSDGMISDRFQKHSWVTSDGILHLLIRARDASPALALYSLKGAGNFGYERAFAGSGSSSTSDGILINDNLYLVYDTAPGRIAFARLLYSAGNWTVVATSQVYSNSAPKIAERPTLSVDNTGKIWVGFILQGTKNSDFIVSSSTDGLNWSLETVPLPGCAATTARSLRILSGSGAVYALYSDQSSFGLSVFQFGTWQSLGIFYSQAPPSQGMLDPNGTHFSATLDLGGNLYFLTNDGAYHGVFLRYDRIGSQWSTPVLFTPSSPLIRAAYMQISGNKVGQLAAIFSARDGAQNGLIVYRSYDSGLNWSQTGELLPNQAGTDNARMETPELLAPSQPIFQQILLPDGVTQSLVEYSIP